MIKRSLKIFKIGGNVIDNAKELENFLEKFSKISGDKILIHGGGKLANKLLKRLGIEPQMNEGRRITDKATLEIVTMLYAGLINKRIVASLQRYDCNAIGLSGCDGNVFRTTIRQKEPIDFGFVGDLDNNSVNVGFVDLILRNGLTPVINSINHDGNGMLLNTNADTIAYFVANSMSELYSAELYLCFEKPGVLEDVNNDGSVIKKINLSKYQKLMEEKKIENGMIPKLKSAFSLINSAVNKVIICSASDAFDIAENLTTKGTIIEL
jgi:acetylglutamate kinase